LRSKVIELAEAVREIPDDGADIALGGFAITRDPIAFVNEMIRKNKKNLKVYNLCVFGFSEAEKKRQLDSIHPGVSIEQVKENTEASFLVPAKVKITAETSKEEIELLEKQIDPDHQYI